MIYSVAEFKMKVLEELLRVLSPNRRIFVTAVLLDSKMLQLILFICSEGSIFRLLVWQWSRFIIKNSQHQSAGMRKLMIYDGELSLCHLKFQVNVILKDFSLQVFSFETISYFGVDTILLPISICIHVVYRQLDS